MATEFILIPKHKYEQLQKNASTSLEGYPLQHHQPTVLLLQQVMLNDSNIPTKLFYDPDHAKLDETSMPDTNSDNDDDDYDTTDVLENFNSSEVKFMQPILCLMEQNADILTGNKKTGEIVIHNQNIRDSNVIKLLKDMFTANLHPVGKVEFYR